MMVALTIAVCLSVAASIEVAESSGESDASPVEDVFMPNDPFVPGMSPPIVADAVQEHNMNWGGWSQARSGLSGGFVELNPAERKKLNDKEMDVRVAQAAVVGQERELRRIEKRFETVSRTDRANMHDYRQKYLNEERQQKMYDAELRDDNRLNIYQASLINNFTGVKTKQMSLTEIEARVRSKLSTEMVNLTSLLNDIKDLEKVNETLNGPGRDEDRFDVQQANLMVVGSRLTEEFNNNVYKVRDITNRSNLLVSQLDKAEVVLREILREFVAQENRASLKKMIESKGTAEFDSVLEKFGIGNWAA